MFLEFSGSLGADLPLDVLGSAGGTISAGTSVQSYYVAYDPGNTSLRTVGQIQMSVAIQGLIISGGTVGPCSGSTLYNTDATVGNVTPRAPAGCETVYGNPGGGSAPVNANRGLKCGTPTWPVPGAPGQDDYYQLATTSIANDTMDFSIYAGQAVDGFRVIVLL